MKRLRVILLFGLLGAIVNVAVAWGCAIYWEDYGYLWRGEYLLTNPSRLALPPETKTFWVVLEHDSFSSTVLWGKGFVDTTLRKASTKYMPHIPNWSHISVPPTMRMNVTEKSYGWPFRTLYWVETDRFYKRPGRTYWWTQTGPSRHVATNQHVWIVQKQPWNVWILPNKRSKKFSLPLAPIWKGVLLNTLFYALLFRLLIITPGRMRRMFRRKRGLCVKCAYDLRGAEHEACPECGMEVPLQ